jgi:hypothetical protein
LLTLLDFFGDDETLPKQDQLMSGTELKTADDSFHPGECYGDTTRE